MEVSVKVHPANIGGQLTNTSLFNRNSSHGIDLVQKFNPQKVPYIPDDLVWYKYEISWQQLAKQRLEGNLLHYELSISTNEVLNISNSQKASIDAAYKNLIIAINGNYSTQFCEEVSKYEESEWKIIVDFSPREYEV